MRIVSVAQMVQLEKEANQGGFSYDEMMARAGKGLAETIHQSYYKNECQKILGLVGSGKNGGDTLVALTRLAETGWQAQAYLVKDRNQNDPLLRDFGEKGGEIAHANADRAFAQLKKWTKNADVIIDGILGTGIQLPLRDEITDILKAVNSIRGNKIIVAVDCPSGVNCDSGETADECLRADLTVCMAAVKRGLLKFPARKFTGRITVAEIGLPRSLKGWENVTGDLLSPEVIAKTLPQRELESHKGSFGTCMIVSGSINFCGAVLLAVRGAYRVGAGLVRAAIPGAIFDTVAGQLPEATWLVLPHTDGVINREGAKLLLKNLDRVTAFLLGPGLGTENETREFVDDLLGMAQSSVSNKRAIGFAEPSPRSFDGSRIKLPPMVIDADGLKLLAEIKDWYKKLLSPVILTPHPGEMSVLTGLSINEIQNNRMEVACDFAKKWGHVVVLKGAMTVVAEPGGKYAVVPIANSALATAGTGDVLSGMITGLVAQGMDTYQASLAGAWLHGQAGLIAAKKQGHAASVMAGDVADAIPDALKSTTGIRI